MNISLVKTPPTIFSECDAEGYSSEVVGCAMKPVAMPKNLSEVLMAQGTLEPLICQKLTAGYREHNQSQAYQQSEKAGFAGNYECSIPAVQARPDDYVDGSQPLPVLFNCQTSRPHCLSLRQAVSEKAVVARTT